MKVSVVIPTHNRSEQLIKTVESVLNQTHKEFEIIIVSDGSTDNTDQVIAELEQRDNRIKGIVYHPSGGANKARNKGIEAAKYEWVAFLDDDDQWYPDKLEAQLKVVQADESIGLVYTGVNVVYINENESYKSLGQHSGDLSREILKSNVIGTTSTVMAKKELLEEVGMFDVDLPAIQDYDLWIRLCQITRVGVVPEEKLYYYNNTASKQISSDLNRYESARERINNKYPALFEQLSESERKSIEVNTALSRANLALRNRDKKNAIKFIRKSLKHGFNVKSIIYLVLLPVPYKYLLKIRNKK